MIHLIIQILLSLNVPSRIRVLYQLRTIKIMFSIIFLCYGWFSAITRILPFFWKIIVGKGITAQICIYEGYWPSFNNLDDLNEAYITFNIHWKFNFVRSNKCKNLFLYTYVLVSLSLYLLKDHWQIIHNFNKYFDF